LVERLSPHEPLFVNTIGHSIGIVVFAVFLYLLWRDTVGTRLRASRLSVAAAALALLWNAASLLAIGLSEAGSAAAEVVVALATTSLSLLPAVLLDVSWGGRNRWTPGIGYLLSAVAIGIHWSEFVLDAPQFHWGALLFTTIGFGVLAVLATVSVLWPRNRQARRTPHLLGAMALFLFALTFVHFGMGYGSLAWPIEVVVHHAGIPLALFVLLQDFRFVLLDAILRVLANLAVAGGVVVLAAQAMALMGLRIGGMESPFRSGLVVAGLSVALVVFAELRERFQRLLTRSLFRRGDLERVLSELRTHKTIPDGGQYLTWALDRVGRYMGAPLWAAGGERTRLPESAGLHSPRLTAEAPGLRSLPGAGGAEVVAPLRLSPEEVSYYWLGRRPGGRPYLSEDLEALGRLMRQVAEHVSHNRDLEMRRLVAQAELRALQSQIHPHFLFNALNVVYGIIPKEARGARGTVLNLADILRYFLQSEKTFIPLGEELKIVRAYLEIEKLRLGARLRTVLDVDDEVLEAPIPMLSLQPLVENAVKHGVGSVPGGGEVSVRVRKDGEWMEFTVSDPGAGPGSTAAGSGPGHGVGLENVRQRLKLCYGEEADLEFRSGGKGTVVGFRIPVREPAGARA